MSPTQPPAISFHSAQQPQAQAAMERLIRHYGQVEPEKASVIVSLGGDGFMLETLHKHLSLHVPIFGMRRGSVGFLCNEYREDGLLERINQVHRVVLHPLRMKAIKTNGETVEALAINDVSLLRESRQAAKLRVVIDGVERLPELICDGIIAATPAGSTAYNLSAHGPILPLSSNIMALTPVSPFRPRRWKGAILAGHAEITIEALESDKRPVSAVADSTEVRDIASVTVREDRNISPALLFDPDQNLEERILQEQFLP